ncbi:MAG: hydrogenase maturation protease [Methylacidiphilales bacterium]|nr:hydrogenase maturation protease [Candidatus Methylacidiphilales bacterium]
MKKTLLVAGIGNIFFGDDAFGSEVARELMRRPLPEEVRVEDYGIRSYDLAYALMDGCDAILIDAVPRGEPPGTLYLIEPDLANLGGGGQIPDAHGMNPVGVLQMVQSLGGRTGRLYLVGCEPSALESDEGRMELSESVQAAVPRAIEMVESLIQDLLHDKNPITPRLAGAAKEVS